MSELESLDQIMPVGPLKIAALEGCREFGAAVDACLVESRKNSHLKPENSNVISQPGYIADTYLLDCSCPRFGTGEGKGQINDSVRGTDLYILVDVCNYSLTYTVCGHVNHMSPDNHFQDLKRIIAAANGKAKRVNVVMPFLYEGGPAFSDIAQSGRGLRFCCRFHTPQTTAKAQLPRPVKIVL